MGDMNEWKCVGCNFLNYPNRTHCHQCQMAKPVNVNSPHFQRVGGGGGAAGRNPGMWSRSDEGVQTSNIGMAQPTPSPQVSTAAEEIQRVDRQLAEVDEELAQLKIRRDHEILAAAKEGGVIMMDPEVVAEKIYKENATRLGLAYPVPVPDDDSWMNVLAKEEAAAAAAAASAAEATDAVPPAESAATTTTIDVKKEPTLTTTSIAAEPFACQPWEYECYQETETKQKELGQLIHKEIRRRKLATYYEMRMTGERMAKMCELYADQAQYWANIMDNGEAQYSADQVKRNMERNVVLQPGGLMRLSQKRKAGDARWDSSLAPEVEMEWNKDLLKYTFDDQTQRVHDPLAEHRERRAPLRWTQEEQDAFVEAYRDYNKEFHVIATKKPFRMSETAPKSTHDIIAYYYHSKHRLDLKKVGARRTLGGGGMQSGGRTPRDRSAAEPARAALPPIPQELVALGISSEAALVAYLKEQQAKQGANKGDEGGEPSGKRAGDGGGGAGVAAEASQAKKSKVDLLEEETMAKANDAAAIGGSVAASGDGAASSGTITSTSSSNGDDTGRLKVVDSVIEWESDHYFDNGPVDDSLPDVPVDFGNGSDVYVVPPDNVDWSELEVAIFKEGLRDYGPDFQRLARDTGKSEAQCKSWFSQHQLEMQRMMKRARQQPFPGPGDWKDDEKVSFRQQVMENGRDWAKLSAAIPGKTEDECKGLWRVFRWRLGLEEAMRAHREEEQQEPPLKTRAI